MISALGSHRRNVAAPSIEGPTKMAAAAAQALRRVRRETGLSIEDTVAKATEDLAANKPTVPEAPHIGPARAGLIDWSKVSRTPRLHCVMGFGFDDVVEHTTAARWQYLESEPSTFSVGDFLDVAGLAVGKRYERRSVNYRGAVRILDADFDSAMKALELLLCADRRERAILKDMGMAKLLALEQLVWGDRGWNNQSRQFGTLTGVAEFDEVVVGTLAPWVSPTSELECRVGDRCWHFRFNDEHAVRVEGRDPRTEMYEQIFDHVTAGLSIAYPDLFDKHLMSAIRDTAIVVAGNNTDEGAIADSSVWLLELLANRQPDEQHEQVRQSLVDRLHRSADSYVPKESVEPSSVLVPSAERGAIARIRGGQNPLSLV